MQFNRKKNLIGAGLLALGLVAAGCGGSGSTTSSGGNDSAGPIEVASNPIYDAGTTQADAQGGTTTTVNLDGGGINTGVLIPRPASVAAGTPVALVDAGAATFPGLRTAPGSGAASIRMSALNPSTGQFGDEVDSGAQLNEDGTYSFGSGVNGRADQGRVVFGLPEGTYQARVRGPLYIISSSGGNNQRLDIKGSFIVRFQVVRSGNRAFASLPTRLNGNIPGNNTSLTGLSLTSTLGTLFAGNTQSLFFRTSNGIERKQTRSGRIVTFRDIVNPVQIPVDGLTTVSYSTIGDAQP